MQGVTNAALRQKESGRFGFINPMDGEKGDAFSSIPITNVRFDVAVTADNTTGNQKSAGLNIRVIEARVGKEGAERVTGESRVTFDVPVCLPTTKLSR